MKYATFEHGGRERVGLVDTAADRIHPLDVDGMVAILARPRVPMPDLKGGGLDLAEVRLLAPIPRPHRNIFCVGKNYREHAREFTKSGFDSSARSAGEAIPDVPIIFTKVPETVIGSGEEILYPSGVSAALDYEAELGVVIGKRGRHIPRSSAADWVWGYTIINDVTARDWQQRHKQWFLGKSFDSFCPMGPWLVTADEVDASNLSIRCWVNDELRQDANTGDLIFDIPTLIETISAGITLYPGDVIATGTPKGVGVGFDPPRYLQPGDCIRIAIDGLGILVNRVGLNSDERSHVSPLETR
jgi:2-keto-4-pentenoate hydratase/2-oxohepta-3-ene-1,7-dioic acid hydratase in catechol pathway